MNFTADNCDKKKKKKERREKDFFHAFKGSLHCLVELLHILVLQLPVLSHSIICHRYAIGFLCFKLDQ